MATQTPLTFPPKVLAAPLSAAGTRLILPDLHHWDYETSGASLTSGEVGTVIYATLQNFSRSRMEILELDASTLDVATTTGILINKRALSFMGGTTANVETAFDHVANETLVMLGSNPPQLYTDLADLTEAQTFTAVKTLTSTAKWVYNAAPTFSADQELITKKYADDLAIAGAPDGAEAVKGIYEAATQTEVDEGDDVGTTTAPTVVRPSKVANAVQRGVWVQFTETASGDDAYTATTTPSFTPANGSMVMGSLATANTTGATFSLNSETPVAIQKVVSGALGALETGDIIANVPLLFYRTASVWVLMSPGGTMPTTALLSEMATFFAATDISGAEAEMLTDDSSAHTLHWHDEIYNAESALASHAYFRGGFNDGLTATQNATGTVTRGLAATGLFVTAAGDDAMLSNGNIAIDNISGDQTADFDSDHSYHGVMSIKFSATTEQDFFYGIVAASLAEAPANATLTTRHVAFMIEDGTIYASVADGTTQSRTDVSSGITLTVFNEFRFEFTGNGSALFYINGTLVATKATNTPVDGTSNVEFWCALTGVGANDKFVTIKHPFLLKVANYS
jgi:hypothetical protein